MADFELSPEEVVLQPSDYDLPQYVSHHYRAHLEKMKQPVKVTRKQMQFFGARGVPMVDVEKFYGVDRVTLQRYYKADYDKGFAATNVSLRSKMVELALAGNPTMLIWLGKNRLNMSDNGPTGDDATPPTPTKIVLQLETNDDPGMQDLKDLLEAKVKDAAK